MTRFISGKNLFMITCIHNHNDTSPAHRKCLEPLYFPVFLISGCLKFRQCYWHTKVVFGRKINRMSTQGIRRSKYVRCTHKWTASIGSQFPQIKSVTLPQPTWPGHCDVPAIQCSEHNSRVSLMSRKVPSSLEDADLWRLSFLSTGRQNLLSPDMALRDIDIELVMSRAMSRMSKAWKTFIQGAIRTSPLLPPGVLDTWMETQNHIAEA